MFYLYDKNTGKIFNVISNNKYSDSDFGILKNGDISKIDTHYVKNEKLMKRKKSKIKLSSSVLRANGEAEIELLNLPKNCTVLLRHDQEPYFLYDIDDGEFKFSTCKIGYYTVIVKNVVDTLDFKEIFYAS